MNRRSNSNGLRRKAAVGLPNFDFKFVDVKAVYTAIELIPVADQFQLIQIGVFNHIVRVGPAEVIVESNSHERCPNKSHT